MRTGYKRRLRRDPFEYLKDLRRRSAAGVIRLPWGGWCVSDVELAGELLRSPEFNTGASGFFGELLPTRAAQVAIGQAARNILRTRVPEYRDALAGALADLPATSRWPAAGATGSPGGSHGASATTPDTPAASASAHGRPRVPRPG